MIWRNLFTVSWHVRSLDTFRSGAGVEEKPRRPASCGREEAERRGCSSTPAPDLGIKTTSTCSRTAKNFCQSFLHLLHPLTLRYLGACATKKWVMVLADFIP